MENNTKETFNAEKALWAVLQHRELTGIKFARRYSIGRYTIDFYSPEHRLAIELDAESFREKNAYDKKRESFITSKGIKILRISRAQVKKGLSRFFISIYHKKAFR